MNLSRQNVLDAAVQLLAQSGLSGAGLNDVIALSGASRGSLYHYFPKGKEQWVTEALERYAEAFWAGCEAALGKAPTRAEGVVDIFRYAARGMKATKYRGGCPVGAVALDLGAEADALRTVCLAIMTRWQQRLALHFAPLPASSALALAKTVIASFEGALMLARLERSTAPLVHASKHMALLIEAHAP